MVLLRLFRELFGKLNYLIQVRRHGIRLPSYSTLPLSARFQMMLLARSFWPGSERPPLPGRCFCRLSEWIRRSQCFTSVDPLLPASESKRSNRAYDADGHTESNGTSTGIVLGDPQAQEWAEKALKHLEPDVKCIHIRPFYMHGSRWPSCLAVPLVSAGDTVGCFIIGRPEGYRFYSEDIDYCEDIRRSGVIVITLWLAWA